MSERDKEQPQSGNKAGQTPGSSESKTGIGSSQGQDKGERESSKDGGAGTADIERGSAHDTSAQPQDSLVNDPTGAFKERP